MTHAIDTEQLTPLDGEELSKVIGVISDLTADDPVLSDAISDLSELSGATLFDGIDPSPDGIFRVTGTNKFEATATIYVTLQYGGSKDAVSMSDAYPASVAGHFDGAAIVVDDVSVDTSSFYE